MNDYQKIIIEDNRDYILRDLQDVEEVLLVLRSSETINEDDLTLIQRAQKKGAKLLDVLLKKSNFSWFEEFCKALATGYPWISKKLSEDFNEKADRRKEFYLHARGNVPLLPQPNIQRSDCTQQLRKDIRCLKRHHYLVIHGMSGCGKTSLASNALNDITLLESSLNGCVYWLSVGELRHNETAEDLHCQELQKKLCDMVNLTTNPQNDLSSQLKHYFSHGHSNSALLVLDNVVSSKVIKALDIGCKTLVTTNDSGVMADVTQRCKYFTVQSGFTESESVQLLTEFVVGLNGPLPPKIRRCAINIHHAWKGQPMIIGLIGGQLAEKSDEAIDSEACWKEYERNPTRENNGDATSRRKSLVEQQMTSIIGKTIDKLDPELRKLYQMLVVFVEDANITCKLLETLWEKNRTDAECLMNTFCRRSLAVKKHHPELKVWVYGIHAMLVTHLRENISAEDLQCMHGDLLKKYHKKCGGDFSSLPIYDNYFFTYICHHIEKANMWNEYRNQFFTLEYLNSKLLATGPGDLLLDLHKYHEGLVGGNDNFKEQLNDIVKFVESSGWDIHKHKMNLIQCALLEPNESIVKRWASERIPTLSSDESPEVYFIPLNNANDKLKEIEFQSPNVRALCIIPSTNRDDKVLIAPYYKDGYIAEVDMRYRSKRRLFEVSDVSLLSLYKDMFLSGSDNGYVKVWSLTSENSSHADTPPPSVRQINYEDLQHNELRTTPLMHRRHNASVTCATFSQDGHSIVSSSDAGDVVVWNIETDTIVQNILVHPSPSAIACAFLPDCNMIVYGCSDHKVYFCENQSGELKVTEETDRNFGKIINILTVTDAIRKIVVVQSNAVSLWYWDAQTLVHQVDGDRKTHFQGLTKQILHKENSSITCAAFAEGRVVIGTSRSGCCLFKIDDMHGKIHPSWIGTGMIKAVDLSCDRLVYSTGLSVRMCWPEIGSSFSNTNQDCIFSLGWSKRHVSVFASISKNKQLLVYHNGRLTVDRLLQHELSIICLSEDGNNMIGGCHDGRIIHFDLVANNLECLVEEPLPSEVIYLQFKSLNNNDSVCVAAADPRVSDSKDKCFMQVINPRSHVSVKCSGLSCRLVECFAHFSRLIAVLCDYSLLVWNLSYQHENCQPVAHHTLQEGRSSAKVTGARISSNFETLVVSDEEKCFHVFSINWTDFFKNDHVSCITKFQSVRLKIPSLTLLPIQPLSSSSSIGSLHSGDEVDGGMISSLSLMNPFSTMATYGLPESAWCCDISCDGSLIALGCGSNKVHIWHTDKKTDIKFDVLPNSQSKVSYLKFSKKGIFICKKTYERVLLVVTDCFSLWDISPLFAGRNQGTSPVLLGCVKSGGLPFIDCAQNRFFTKFAGVDFDGSYFLWEIKD